MPATTATVAGLEHHLNLHTPVLFITYKILYLNAIYKTLSKRIKVTITNARCDSRAAAVR